MNVGTWIEIGGIGVDWEIKVDEITRGIQLPIQQINYLVQLFSLGYMEADPHRNRYHLLLNIFVVTMIQLVTADNLFILFLGWEGVGLASYFQINFWYTRIYANQAGIKAFLTNRVGDWGLTLGLLFYWAIYGNFSLEVQNLYGGDLWSPALLSLAGYGCFAGAITKSAQIGLHSWLTRSMEGPTPVSAQLHAATMVTAGVYQILRMNIMIEWTSTIPLCAAYLGGLSALGGAIGGQLEQDIKKIIAYSTISQLGYMFVAIGQGEAHLSLWHLVNHACFKALLFLSGGALIHSLFGLQDIRKYGGAMTGSIPALRVAFQIGNLSIMAIPFMTGWWTKDAILLEVYKSNTFLFLLIYVAAIITAAYSIKLFIASFKSIPRLNANIYSGADLSNRLGQRFALPMQVLGICAVILGYQSSAVPTPGVMNLLGSMGGVPGQSSITSTFFAPLVLAGGPQTVSCILLLGCFARVSWQAFGRGLWSASILDAIDMIYLKALTVWVAPSSTYQARSAQGFLEIFTGGTGVTRLVEGLAWMGGGFATTRTR